MRATHYDAYLCQTPQVNANSPAGFPSSAPTAGSSPGTPASWAGSLVCSPLPAWSRRRGSRSDGENTETPVGLLFRLGTEAGGRRTPLPLGSAPHVSSSVNCGGSSRDNYLPQSTPTGSFFTCVAQEVKPERTLRPERSRASLSGESRPHTGRYNKFCSDHNVSNL